MRQFCGVGRVIIPPKQDRTLYIEHCYQTSTISIVGRENLDIVHDVDIDPDILQRIVFPNDSTLLGSTIVWINIPVFNRPIVISLLNNKDEMTHLEEDYFSFIRDGADGTVSITGKAKGSQIDISAHSTTGKGGSIRINVGNYNNTGKLEVVVKGNLLTKGITSQTLLRDSYSLEINNGKKGTKSTFHKLDSKTIESRVQGGTSGYKVEEKVFEIGDASEKAVLANALDTFMSNLIDVIASQTVVTSLGTQPLVNAAGITAMKAQTKKWISTYLKIQ